jgi:hypothetical protein
MREREREKYIIALAFIIFKYKQLIYGSTAWQDILFFRKIGRILLDFN